MKTLKLTFTERIYLMEIMPQQDSINNLIVRKDLLKRIELQQEESIANKFTTDEQGKSGWRDNGKRKEVKLTEPENLYLKERLKEASEKKNLSEHLIDVYQQIV